MEQQHPPFESLSFFEKQLLYQGLLALVKSNSGLGFANSDQGHPAYAIGREGKFDFWMWGDSPEHNSLFKLMHSLSVELCIAEIDGKPEISDYVFSWSDFCHLAFEAYEKATTQSGA